MIFRPYRMKPFTISCAHHSHRSPEVIVYGDLPAPKPGPAQCLVKVAAVAVNPIDTYVRGGMVPAQLNFPHILGCDLAGEVIEAGPEVKRFRPGDRVWASNQGLFGRAGSFAEFAAVDEDWLYPIPDGVKDEAAVALSLVGITAHLGLFRDARLQAGEVLFVNGGTGGMSVRRWCKWASSPGRVSSPPPGVRPK